MDLNLVVLSGRLAAPPELRVLDSGTRLVRYLVTVSTEDPRHRIDVLPVTLWHPPEDVLSLDVGERVFVVGSVQRRFWSNPERRRSRLEIVAEHIAVRSLAREDAEAS
jgi:single-strand DNA-binding protein